MEFGKGQLHSFKGDAAGGSKLIEQTLVYVIYGSFVHTDSKKTVLFTPPTAGFIPSMQLLRGN